VLKDILIGAFVGGTSSVLTIWLLVQAGVLRLI
jgi:hypothetical protein